MVYVYIQILNNHKYSNTQNSTYTYNNCNWYLAGVSDTKKQESIPMCTSISAFVLVFEVTHNLRTMQEQKHSYIQIPL